MRDLNYANSLSLNIRKANGKRMVRELNKRGSWRFISLTNRIASKLNELSISAKTVNSFKARIHKEIFGMDRSKDCNDSAVG